MSISTASDADIAGALAAHVREATAKRTPLRIVGGDTKRFYGRQVGGEVLEVSGHRGILSYDPSELVITARAGTPILEIEAALADHDQMLAFEPPILGEASTLGGVVASGLAGPRRPFAGAVRDFILGVTVLDGRGEALRLGGTVFKNVAGFDGFRLMSGALGCLGVLLDVSVRVTPRAPAEASVTIDEDWPSSKRRLAEILRRQSCVSAALHDGTRLHLRLSGSEKAVANTTASLAGQPGDPTFWSNVRNMRVSAGPRLWRLSIPASSEMPSIAGDRVVDWAGAQIWLEIDTPATDIREACARIGGHATLFRGAKVGEDVFTPLPPALLALHKRIKAAFDPAGIFNPGRMFEDL